MDKLKFLDMLVYHLFYWWWTPILKKRPDLRKFILSYMQKYDEQSPMLNPQAVQKSLADKDPPNEFDAALAYTYRELSEERQITLAKDFQYQRLSAEKTANFLFGLKVAAGLRERATNLTEMAKTSEAARVEMDVLKRVANELMVETGG